MMRVKEYLLNKEIIISGLLVKYPFLSEEGKDSINGKFEFELGDLPLYYEDEDKINRAVDYVLKKNSVKYSEIDKTLKLVIPLEYQKLITHEGSNKEDINKSINVLGGSSTTEEGTITKEGSTILTNTTDNTNTIDTTLDTTDTKSDKSNIKSVKGFDGVEFVESEKNVENQLAPDTVKNVGKDTTVGQIKDNGSTTINDTDTVEKLITVENNSDTTDTTGIIGSENYTEKEQSIEVLDRIEQYRALYNISLWDIIVEDIKKVICLSVWEY